MEFKVLKYDPLTSTELELEYLVSLLTSLQRFCKHPHDHMQYILIIISSHSFLQIFGLNSRSKQKHIIYYDIVILKTLFFIKTQIQEQ